MKTWPAYETPQGEDCAAEINRELEKIQTHGGCLHLNNHAYGICAPVVLDGSSLCLAGVVWACNTDPNGVFETDCGTKLRMHGTAFPALLMGKNAGLISGAEVKNLGVQGDISGMDTRAITDFAHPERAAGLCLGSGRKDQCAFEKLSFCGCSSAVCAAPDAEIDACVFEKINTDGCGNGFHFAPGASYYARVRFCVMADNPFYGFYAQDARGKMHNLEISACTFVRNAGAFAEGDGRIPAAVLFDRVNACAVDRCLFDAPGTYWHYALDAVSNSQRQISRRKSTALYVIGSRNRVTNNTFLHSSDASVRIEGDENILMNNISDGSVYIAGRGNTIVNHVFTKPDARLILRGEAAETTGVIGVPEERIVRVGE